MSHTRPRLVLRYAQTSCAVKRKGQSHHTAAGLRHVSLSLFATVAAHAHYLPHEDREVFVAALLTQCLSPHPQPPMSMCRSAAAASVALNRRKKVYHLRFSARYGRRLPERIRFLRCKSGVGLLRRADTRLRSLQKPMLNKLSGNAYGSPTHTLAPQSLAPLTSLHRTSTSPYHKIKPQSEFEARFCLAVVGKPTILKSGSLSAPPKPPLRFGSSSHIGDFTAHRPAYSARRRPKFSFGRRGRSGGLHRQCRGKAPNPRNR